MKISASGNYSIAPQTIGEEVEQNLRFLLASKEYDCPLDRGVGLNTSYIDRRTEAAKALMLADLYDKVGRCEPRAEIVNVEFEEDLQQGILRPVLEVKINGK